MPQDSFALNAAQRRVDITEPPSVDWALAEILRLNAWFKVLSKCEPQSSAEEGYARRIKYIARRALNGDAP